MTERAAYHIEFYLPGLPKTTNAQNGLHWRQKAAETKKWHQLVSLVIGKRRPRQALPRASLYLVRYSAREPDFDNLVVSFKPVIDGLKKAGIILDDKMSVIGQPKYEWQRAARNEGQVWVSVREVTCQSGSVSSSGSSQGGPSE